MPMKTRGARKPAGFWAGSTTTKKSGHVKTTKTKGRKVVAKADKVLTQAITRVIRGAAETKYVAETLLNGVNFNSGIGSSNPLVPNEWYRCIPLVVPYTTSGQQSSFIRAGKVIQPTSCKVHIRCGFDYRDAYQRDITVVFYMIQSKTARTYFSGSASQPFETRILDNGDGTNVRFAGTFLDSTKPIDKDGIVLLKKKTFRLHKGQGVLTTNAISTGQGSYTGGKSFTVKVKLPKKLQYEETLQTPAHNAPVWGLGYYYNDTSAPDLDLTAGVLWVDARTEMWFDDE